MTTPNSTVASMAEDFGEPTDDLQRILRLTAPGFDPDDLRKVEEGFRSQNLVTPSKTIYWNGGAFNKEKVEMPEIEPLMTKMAETSEVQPDDANHRQIVFEVISMSRSFAKESAAQAIRGPDKKTGADAERLQSAEYTKFAAQFGFIPALDQQIPPEQMSKLRDKMLFNGTAELTVMLRMKNETANSAMKEKRTSLGPIGELVVESVDSEEASRNGQILARMLTLLIALCAVGCRPMAQGQGMMSDKGVVGQADGTTCVVYFHWNEAMLLFSLMVKASANYGPSDLKKMWEFHWVTANESVNESGGSMNLSSAVNASVKGHMTEQILGAPKTAPAIASVASGHQGGFGGSSPKSKAPKGTTCNNYNLEKGCSNGSTCRFVHRCARCGEMGHAATRCRKRDRSRSAERHGGRQGGWRSPERRTGDDSRRRPGDRRGAGGRP